MVTESTKTLILKFQADTELARGELKALIGALGQTTTEVDQRLARIESSFQKAGRGIKESASTASIAVGAFLGSFASNVISQLPGQLQAIVTTATDTAGSIKNVAEALGIGTNSLQVFRLGASKAGVDVSKADEALEKFTQTTGKAAGGNRAALAAFDAIGVSLKDAEGNLKPFAQLLPEVFDGIAKLPDPARQSAAAIALLGSNGDDLLPFLRGGAEGLNDLATSAARLGLVLTPEQIKNLDELGNKASDLKRLFDAQLAAAIGDNADALLRLGDAFAGLVGKAIKAGQTIADFYRGSQIIRQEQGLFATAFASDEEKIGRGRGERLKTQFRNSIDAFAAGGFGLNDGPASGGAVVDPPQAPARTTRAARAGKPEMTPAEQRLAFMSPGNPGDFSGLTDAAGKVKDVGLELDNIFGKFQDIQTVAVDLSNIEIIDQAQIDAADRFGQNIARNLAQAIVLGDDLGDALVNAFQAAAAEAIASGLFDLLSGAFSSILGGSGGFLSGLFGRAVGGPVTSGKAYMVGERGPELFVPSGNGNIIANKYMGGGAGGGTINNFDLRGAVVTEDLYRQMQQVGMQAAQAGALGGRALAAADRSQRARRRLG